MYVVKTKVILPILTRREICKIRMLSVKLAHWKEARSWLSCWRN